MRARRYHKNTKLCHRVESERISTRIFETKSRNGAKNIQSKNDICLQKLFGTRLFSTQLKLWQLQLTFDGKRSGKRIAQKFSLMRCAVVAGELVVVYGSSSFILRNIEMKANNRKKASFYFTLTLFYPHRDILKGKWKM